MKPKLENVVKAIRQGEAETLREYIKRFNKEVINVRYLYDMMRMYFMKDGLSPGSLFQIDIDVN